MKRRPTSAEPVDYRQPIHLDWREYYKGFEKRHGEPILWKGRLLFRDGWQYSSTDYAGPEWEPPTDPVLLHEVQYLYWQERLKLVSTECEQLEMQLKGLVNLQQAKSLPLVRKVKRWDPDSNSMKVDREEVSPDIFKGRLDWLHADIEECNEQLQIIRQGIPNEPAVNAGINQSQ